MAQYFPRRRQSSVAREAPHRSQQQEQAWSARELAESSVYVFPSPSSAPPSPSQISDLSVPTDFTISSAVLSESSRESSVLPACRNPGPQRQSWFSPSPLSTPLSLLDDGADVDIDQWEWEPGNAAEDSLLVGADDEGDRLDRWEVLSRRRARDQFLCSLSILQAKLSSSNSIALKGSRKASSPPAGVANATPHARIHIPLLSFLVSLLSVDDGTLHLLTHSSGHSALFPGNALLPPGDSETTAMERETELHGMEKLLADRPNESRTMKGGMGVASNPAYTPSTPFLSPYHLVGLWDIVSGLVANGGKALREALQTPP